MDGVVTVISYVLGYGIGAIIGVWSYSKISDIKEQLRIKRIINKHNHEGKETCPLCFSGLTLDTVGVKNKVGNDAIIKCYFCGGNSVAEINNNFKIKGGN